MHRVPLKLNEPSYTWDRNLPDYELFEMALNTDNVQDVTNYVAQIDIELEAFREASRVAAMNEYVEAQKMLSKDENAALCIFDKIILHAPRDGRALVLSLQMRANLYYKKKCYDGASNDYECLLYLTNNVVDNILAIYGKLFICHFMLGKYDKAQEAYEMYSRHLVLSGQSVKPGQPGQPGQPNQPGQPKRKGKKGKGKAPAIIQPKLEPDMQLLDATIEELYEQIEKRHVTPATMKKEAQQGSLCFNLLCEENEETGEERSRQYSKTNLPTNAVILSERPINRTICTPWLQCEQCLELSEHVYTCLDCRLKTYCSMDCLKSDKYHVEECKGTKYLMVLMLNAQQLYRTFIDVIYLIKDHIVGHKSSRRVKTAGDVLNAIRTYAKDFNIPLLKLLAQNADYTQTSYMQFSTILATSLRLAVFISLKTNLIEEIRPAFKISQKQELIVVGSLLMQLQYHLQRGSFLYYFDVPCTRNPPKKRKITFRLEDQMEENGIRIFPKSGTQRASDFFFLDPEMILRRFVACMTSNIEADSIPPLPEHLQDEPPPLSEDIIIPALELSDYAARLALPNAFTDNDDDDGSALSEYIAGMDFEEREDFLAAYFVQFNRNLFNFFLKKRITYEERPVRQVIVLLGRELQKFRHSCDPNVEVMLLTSGFIVGKTLRPIQKGEECFIAFRSRYFLQNCETRYEILERFNIECRCQYCRMPNKFEPYAMHSNIYCVPICRTEFGISEAYCPGCTRDYSGLVKEYARRISNLEKTFEDDDEREIHKHWIVLDKVASQYFPPYHHYRIMQRLKYAKFIAMNNFVTQALDMTVSAYGDIKSYFPEEHILFTLYPVIMEVLTLLQYFNIDEKLETATTDQLKLMNKLGLKIINAQLKHVKIYEKFDLNCATILTDFRLFWNWKKEIFLMGIDIPALETYIEDNDELPKLKTRRGG